MRIFTSIRQIIIIAVLALFVSCSVEQQELTTAQLFADHMVLQANTSVNVWGTATPGDDVTVVFRSQTVTTAADNSGKWKAVLQAEDYGTDDSLIVKTATQKLTYNDVLVGEVWLASGQSNMEMPVMGNWAHLNNAEVEVANADYPNIRMITVEKALSFTPVDTIITSGWLACDSNTVKNFSATAYFFTRELHKELNVPVGIIHSSWGGTVAEAWTSEKSLSKLEAFAEKAKMINDLDQPLDSLKKKYSADSAELMQEIRNTDIGYDGDKVVFADPEFDDSDWMPIDLPKMWEETELGVYDGSGWFRKTIEIPEAMATGNLSLCYGAVDDWDEAWVNGVKVGAEQEWGKLRVYPIPEGLIKAGENQITIRIYDFGGGGGFMNEAKDYKIISDSGDSISIAEGWVVKKGFDFRNIETNPISVTDPNQPTVLFNAMITPLIPYTFKGVIWYQGESNSGRAHQYRELFKTLITDWRTQFGQGDFPFYFVQLANYLPRNTEPAEDAWAELREAQMMALDLPNTGMAVTIDIGDALDIHPGNKQDVGKRLALNALTKTYGKDIKYMGPLYKDYAVVDNTVEITFDYNKGLCTQDGEALTGFTIAGTDSVFVWADAEIVGDKVVVSNPAVVAPIAVRYAWASNPACNLTNETGLPASPFRNDDWAGITE